VLYSIVADVTVGGPMLVDQYCTKLAFVGIALCFVRFIYDCFPFVLMIEMIDIC
jgi:hypothetical protein